MKAMVLAAGLGTRLRPLTNDRPKALVEVAGKTLLEITLRRLAAIGIREVIVNVHHFADTIAAFLEKNRNFGMRIEISREEMLLDTGGGLKKAGWFFLEGGDSSQPIVMHNVDVISNIDLRRMVQFHEENRALATLAVQQRVTSRYLLFNDDDELCGRKVGQQLPEMARSCHDSHPYAFCGVHVISPRLLSMMSDEGAFSIIATYLRLVGEGHKINAFRADEYYWRDLGKPESVTQAAKDAELRVISI